MLLSDSYPTANIDPVIELPMALLLARALRRPQIHARSIRVCIVTLTVFAIVQFIDARGWSIARLAGVPPRLAALNLLHGANVFWDRWPIVLLAQPEVWRSKREVMD